MFVQEVVRSQEVLGNVARSDGSVQNIGREVNSDTETLVGSGGMGLAAVSHIMTPLVGVEDLLGCPLAVYWVPRSM